MEIRELTTTDELAELLELSEQQGHRFVRRLVDEMTDGTNRFDAPGEALFVASQNGAICGVCGLNHDALSGRTDTSRLRHLYIHPDFRGRGVGRALVERCLDVARQHSDLIVLRTFCLEASAFYQRMGFRLSTLDGATHERALS